MRLATVNDAVELAAIYAPYVRDTSVSFETEPPTAEEFARRIAAVGDRYPYLVHQRDDGTVDGYAYATRYHERDAYRYSVTTSVYLSPDSAGKGLGKKLYGALLAILKEQGYRNAYAVITMPNPQSVGLNERFGFRKNGYLTRCGYKFGKWLDVAIMELFLAEPDTLPAELIPVSGLNRDFLQRTLTQRGKS